MSSSDHGSVDDFDFLRGSGLQPGQIVVWTAGLMDLRDQLLHLQDQARYYEMPTSSEYLEILEGLDSRVRTLIRGGHEL